MSHLQYWSQAFLSLIPTHPSSSSFRILCVMLLLDDDIVGSSSDIPWDHHNIWFLYVFVEFWSASWWNMFGLCISELRDDIRFWCQQTLTLPPSQLLRWQLFWLLGSSNQQQQDSNDQANPTKTRCTKAKQQTWSLLAADTSNAKGIGQCCAVTLRMTIAMFDPNETKSFAGSTTWMGLRGFCSCSCNCCCGCLLLLWLSGKDELNLRLIAWR